MLHSRAYRQPATSGMTRIDLVLVLFDAAIDRLDKAITFLDQGDLNSALTHRLRAQAVVLQLAAGIDIEVGSSTSIDLLRLYEFAAHALATGERGEIAAARHCLDLLRDGFRGIREEAAGLKRSGAIPAADRSRLVEAVG